MSTDVSAVCHVCSESIHLGQRFTSGWSFGYGTGDNETMKAQGEWLMEHIHHEVVVDLSDNVPTKYKRVEVSR